MLSERAPCGFKYIRGLRMRRARMLENKKYDHESNLHNILMCIHWLFLFVYVFFSLSLLILLMWQKIRRIFLFLPNHSLEFSHFFPSLCCFFFVKMTTHEYIKNDKMVMSLGLLPFLRCDRWWWNWDHTPNSIECVILSLDLWWEFAK